MAGWQIVVAECFACKRPFGFNPFRVPSVPIDLVTGLPPDMGGDAARAERQPICRDCMAQINASRVAAGRSAWLILPDAYDPIEAGA